MGLFLGAGCKLEKTNSGLSILPKCSRKLARHGADWGVEGCEVEAMFLWIVREKCARREGSLEAMVAVDVRESTSTVRECRARSECSGDET